MRRERQTSRRERRVLRKERKGLEGVVRGGLGQTFYDAGSIKDDGFYLPVLVTS
jgi:hypothetical protein